jgi:hypothetical protein
MKHLDFLKKAKAMLSTVKLSQKSLDSGTTIEFDGDDIAVGSVVYAQDSAGDWTVIADGEYTTNEGFKFTVKDGVVESTDGEVKKEEEEVIEEKKEEVKQEEIVETVDLAKLVDKKLAPILEKLSSFQTLIEASQKLNQETQQSLSSVTNTVALLAKQPAAKPIDEKEVGGVKKVDPKLQESRLYKIFNS